MSSRTAPLAGSARRTVVLPAPLREHRCHVARASLAAGRPLNLDAITVILGAKHLESTNANLPFTRWTARQLVAFVWGTVGEWCAAQGVVPPRNLGESLWTYLTYLSDTGELASGSSSLARLREALVEQAGVTRSGRTLPPSDANHGAVVRPLHPAGRRKVSR